MRHRLLGQGFEQIPAGVQFKSIERVFAVAGNDDDIQLGIPRPQQPTSAYLLATGKCP